MFLETVDQFATVATVKAAFLRCSPFGFWLSAMMAGAYVGLGIILIFCVGANVDPGIRPVVMGASFGIALTLVIFAGSDLFTGHTMFMTFGWLRGRTDLRDLAACWGASWAGNLAGCVFLAAIFVAGGGGLALAGKNPLIINVAADKDERAGAGTRRPRDALQLAGLPGDLDLSPDDQRHRQVHRDLLVPLRIHRQRV
jgi:nitrite transporter